MNNGCSNAQAIMGSVLAVISIASAGQIFSCIFVLIRGAQVVSKSRGGRGAAGVASSTAGAGGGGMELLPHQLQQVPPVVVGTPVVR